MRRAFAIAALVALTWVASMYLLQDTMIYHPLGYEAGVENQPGRPIVKLPYHDASGDQVAFYLAPVDGKKPARLWIMFGGNGAAILQYRDGLPSQPILAKDGFLLVDYPGYGFDQGKPSGASIQENADTSVAALAKYLDVSQETLLTHAGVFGHSLGTGVALEFAAAHPSISRIVLAAPFTSLYDMAFRVVGPVAHLLHHNFDNAAVLHELGERIPRPQVIIFTGDQDQVIPVAMSRKLARDNPWLTYDELPGYEHNHIVEQAAPLIARAMAGMN